MKLPNADRHKLMLAMFPGWTVVHHESDEDGLRVVLHMPAIAFEAARSPEAVINRMRSVPIPREQPERTVRGYVGRYAPRGAMRARAGL